MKLLLLALLVGACCAAPAIQVESSEAVERVSNNTVADSSCQDHATRQKCGSGCPPTCKHPQSMCMVLICDNPCVCNADYVLLGDECVLLQNCPGYNPDEELGFNDGQDLDDRTGNVAAIEPGMMSEQSEDEPEKPFFPAKTSCAANQVYTECGSACPKTCANPDGPMICNDMCVIGCQCQAGYFLSSEKTCVEVNACF